MKLLKYLLTFALIAGFFAVNGLYAADEQDNSRFEEELNERDFDALRDYLRTKRALNIEESTSTLTISGDVRTEWRHMNETCKGMRLRGKGATQRGLPVSRNDLDIEFNLRFDYICDKAWASSNVRFDCSGGVDDNNHPCKPCDNIKTKGSCRDEALECTGDCEGFHGSGNCVGLCLKKAYFGYELYSCGDSRFFFELGRRGNLYNVFDSNIQFLSRFDGLLLKYEDTWESVADWYVTAAGFLIDERVNHFGWVTEIGFLNIGDTGLDFKYSLIDWQKRHGINRCFVRNPIGFRFLNSQFTTIYNLNPEWMGRPVKIYGAVLVNHAANDLNERENLSEEQRKAIPHGRQNLGWYTGILIGKVRKEGDWALEIQYQYVQANAMPDGDVGGIGRGNVLDESFTTCSLRGNTNFKGWRVQGLYAFTDNLSLDTILEWSQAIDDRIGGAHTYSKFEMEAIYAF